MKNALLMKCAQGLLQRVLLIANSCAKIELIRNNCYEALEKIHFSKLTNKKLAVDISIYLYKYKLENTLVESIYLMISLFRLHNIIPVFIFDGKPPAEKKELLL